MKKLLVAVAGLVILTGCSSVQQEVTDVAPVESTEKLLEENQVLYDLPEYPILDDIIDLQVFKAKIETDNQETRVIFFVDPEGIQVYKSVFVKNESYLKVMELDGEGILYNEVI